MRIKHPTPETKKISSKPPVFMLGQGCIRAVFGEQLISTSSGLEIGFCRFPEMGPKVGKKWLLGAKVGENASRPTPYQL